MDALPSPLDLARFQFAFVVVWHFLFPAFAIGLANFLVGLESCGPGQNSPPTSRSLAAYGKLPPSYLLVGAAVSTRGISPTTPTPGGFSERSPRQSDLLFLAERASP
jgi:hypothetical protein